MKVDKKKLALSIALPLATGGLSAFLTRDGMKAFEGINKPPLAPPQWAFPVVWTALYVGMGIAAYLVDSSDASQIRKDRAFTAYYIQLALNFVWSLIFFGMGLYLVAFCELVLLWAAVAVTLVLFRAIRKPAGNIMIPYLIWLTLAMYLNWGVYTLN